MKAPRASIFIVFLPLLALGGCMVMHGMHGGHEDSKSQELNHEGTHAPKKYEKDQESAGNNQPAIESKDTEHKKSKMWILGGIGMVMMMVVMMVF